MIREISCHTCDMGFGEMLLLPVEYCECLRSNIRIDVYCKCSELGMIMLPADRTQFCHCDSNTCRIFSADIVSFHFQTRRTNEVFYTTPCFPSCAASVFIMAWTSRRSTWAGDLDSGNGDTPTHWTDVYTSSRFANGNP